MSVLACHCMDPNLQRCSLRPCMPLFWKWHPDVRYPPAHLMSRSKARLGVVEGHRNSPPPELRHSRANTRSRASAHEPAQIGARSAGFRHRSSWWSYLPKSPPRRSFEKHRFYTGQCQFWGSAEDTHGDECGQRNGPRWALRARLGKNVRESVPFDRCLFDPLHLTLGGLIKG